MKKLLTIMLVFIMAMALVSCRDDGGLIEWDYMNLDSPVYPSIPMLIEWSNEIYRRTDGRFRIHIRVGGELPFTTGEYIEVVSNGLVEMAGAMITAVSPSLRAASLPSLPFMITNEESFHAVMNVLNPYLDEELAEWGVFNAMTLFHPYQEIYGIGPIPSSYRDLAGLRLRTTGAQQARFWHEVGLVPTPIDAAEVSSALNTRIIEGVTAASMAVDLNRWYESLEWVYVCNQMFIPVYVVVNNAAWNRLPADIQDVFKEVTAEFIATYPQRIIEAHHRSLAHMEANGIVFIEASQEDRQALQNIAVPLWREFAAANGANAQRALAEIERVLNITQ